MRTFLLEIDDDQVGSVSVENGQNLAREIDKNKTENQSLDGVQVPSQRDQDKSKNGGQATLSVDASKGGAEAVKNLNNQYAKNPSLKNAVNNGDVRVVADYGRTNESTDVLYRMTKENLDKFLKWNR